MGAALAYEQIPLFRRLQQPRSAKRKRRRSRIVVFVERVIGWMQLELQLPEPIDPYRDDEFDFPKHRIVSAAAERPPATNAPPSIFALAARIAAKARRGAHRSDASFLPSIPARLQSVAVERGHSQGVTRNVGSMYPAGRWTPEKEEAERVRRAKQRPPKPTKAARTRGEKVRAWDGEGDL